MFPACWCYTCAFPLCTSHVTAESSESGGRRDTGASLDSVGASSGSLSPLEPPSPLFPPDGGSSESSLTSEVFLNVLKLNQNRKRQENRYGTPSLHNTNIPVFCRKKNSNFVQKYNGNQFFLMKNSTKKKSSNPYRSLVQICDSEHLIMWLQLHLVVEDRKWR